MEETRRPLDAMARLMTDAAGVAQSVRREAETALRAQAERFLGDMDLVHRDDFEALKAMVVGLKAEIADLRRQLGERPQGAADADR